MALLIALYVYFEIQAQPQIKMIVENRAKVLAETVINESVNEVLKSYNFKYSDLVDISQSENGSVQSISTKITTVNTLKTEINLKAQQELSKIHNMDVKIPLGSFSGLVFMSEFGPQLTFNLELTGDFDSELVSTFTSAGVNQTVHHIELIVYSNIVVTSPINDNDIDFETNFDIAQTVIVGNTPNLYANSK